MALGGEVPFSTPEEGRQSLTVQAFAEFSTIVDKSAPAINTLWNRYLARFQGQRTPKPPARLWITLQSWTLESEMADDRPEW